MAGVEVGVAVAVGPPEAGVVDGEGWDVVLGNLDGSLVPTAHTDGLLEGDARGLDDAAHLEAAVLGTGVQDVGRERQLGLVVRGEVAAHPRVTDDGLAGEVEVDVARDARQTSGDVGYPVPPCPSQIAGAARHAIRPWVGARLLLVGIPYQYGKRIGTVAADNVGDVETRAKHMAVDVFFAVGGAGDFHAVQPEVGKAVGVVAAEPHTSAGWRRRGDGELGAVPEGTVVLRLIDAIDVVRHVGILLPSGLNVCGEDYARHHARHRVSHAETDFRHLRALGIYFGGRHQLPLGYAVATT